MKDKKQSFILKLTQKTHNRKHIITNNKIKILNLHNNNDIF